MGNMHSVSGASNCNIILTQMPGAFYGYIRVVSAIRLEVGK